MDGVSIRLAGVFPVTPEGGCDQELEHQVRIPDDVIGGRYDVGTHQPIFEQPDGTGQDELLVLLSKKRVECEPPVEQQVEALRRPVRNRDVDTIPGEHRGDRVKSWGTVLSDGSQERNAMILDKNPAPVSEVGRMARKLGPRHHLRNSLPMLATSE